MADVPTLAQSGMAGNRGLLIKVGRESLNRSLETIRKNMVTDVKPTFSTWLRFTMSRFKGERLVGPPGVSKRSGDLSRSFYTRMTGNDISNLIGKVASRSKYARSLEYGALIRRRRAKMLAIPISGGPALTPGGKARYGGGRLRNTLPGDVRFFTITTKKGAVLLMGQRKNRPAEAWFSLHKGPISLPPKLGLRLVVRKNLKVLREKLGKDMQKAIDRG
jgi:hypothetical protein